MNLDDVVENIAVDHCTGSDLQLSGLYIALDPPENHHAVASYTPLDGLGGTNNERTPLR